MKKIIKVLALFTMILGLLPLGANRTHAEEKKIVVATSGTSDIFSQIMPDTKEWTGIDGEIWKAIEEKTGWTIEVKQVEFDGLIGELETGRSDVVSNHMEITEKRLEKSTASQAYSSEQTVWVVLEENKDALATLESLKGKIIGVKSGQAVQPKVEELSKEYGFEVRTFQDNASMYNDLAMKRVDAVAGMYSQMEANSKKLNVKFTNTGKALLVGNVGFFLQKNEKGEALKKELDPVIQELIEDGTIKAITEKWTGQDLTASIKSEDKKEEASEAPEEESASESQAQ